MKKTFFGALLALILSAAAIPAGAAERFITVASTTSTQNSGLLDYLLPIFTKKTGIHVHVVAVGTGHAIRIAKNGDADVLLVHHRPSEEKFVAEGYGVRRYGVMYNDFIIVGPKTDPAHIKGCKSAARALKEIAAAKLPFVSRGDNSGTNKKENELWKKADVNVNKASGTWYRSTGSGMGATLNTAASMNAYTLSDRGTWISFKNKADLKILCAGDKALFNPYGVILVNPKKFPQVKAKDGQTFIDWLISPEGQKTIGAYRLHGKLLFTPDANNG
ncbi:substrate-binding domain-containing protein [Varunaivibrio sulfuroxidans]|uniref:Tungstate transport system substrate-binding protein n=1 Tax=Varunaivibrio sulfuroxidans TaxID=1773489 RepID=A0A4R3J9M1_9PROT|nr:substrate-binding domain-containing protein [Varunaivibrio sulfuroxidans]TCS62105.1 tungstate transport system substrate-binding protein [Varunaivibrio sulfuroxidans]WES30538.1 substrate-binding domain-containing protein [Varunaivibrio sulfuroxidans]